MTTRQYIDSSTARDDFSDVVGRVRYGHERVIVRKHGKDVAAVIPMEDLDLLERAVEAAEDRIDVLEAERILNDPIEGELVPRRKK